MTAALDPAVLAWALSQPTGSRWQGLADAFSGGTTRVTFDGRTVEYRSLAEISTILAVGYAAETNATRRPGTTYASFTRPA